jgi:succinate dehydrogenase / fumarate reductase membrane anchor subunit
VALVPLTVWFVYSLMTIVVAPAGTAVTQWFANPCNAVLLCLMLVAMFWHAKLGFQVVVEDYVKRPFAKYLLLLANNFVAFSFAAVSILAVLKLHFTITL